MSFSVTVKHISAIQLGPFIESLSLPRGSSYDIRTEQLNNTSQQVSTTSRGNPRREVKGHAESLLTMTGKVPAQKGAMIGVALEEYEKLEKKQGIGNVTLMECQLHFKKLKGKRLKSGIVGRLVTEGYLTYL